MGDEQQAVSSKGRTFLDTHVVNGTTPSTTGTPSSLEQRKIDLKAQYQKDYQNIPATASRVRRATLERLNLQFTGVIGGGSPTAVKLDDAQAVLELIIAEHQAIGEEARALQDDKGRLEDRAEKEFGTDPEGAAGSTLGELTEARKQFDQKLVDTATPDDLAGLNDAFDALGNAHKSVLDDVRKRTETARGEVLKKLRGVVPTEGGSDKIVAGATDDDVNALIETARQIAERIEKASLAGLPAVSDDIDKLGPSIEKIKEVVRQRATDRDELIDAAGKIMRPEGAEDDEWVGLQKAIGGVAEALNVAPLTPLALDAGKKALEDAKSERDRIDRLAGDRKKEHDRIESEGGKLTDPSCLDDQEKALKAARDALADALKAPITAKRNVAAADALEKLRQAIERVNTELADLGGVAAVTTLCQAAGIDPKDPQQYLAFETALGGRSAMGALLKVFPPGQLGPLATTFGGGTTGAGKLKSVLDGFGGGAGVHKAIADLGTDGDKKLAALVTTGGLDAKGAKTLFDDLGGPLLGVLMGSGASATAAIQIQTELGSDTQALRDLTADAGFDGKPAALAALFSKGCAGDAKKFANLCKSFNDKGDRERLKGLVVDGGLGDAPDVLGELFATGCDGDASSLKILGTSFADPGTGKDSRDGLKRMLTKGGLAAGKGTPPDGDVDSACLAQLLKNGAGPKPTGFTGTQADDDKRRSDKLAALFRGLDEPACGQIAKTLKQGGLGTDPEVFGQLVGVGCGGGDPAKLKGLAANLNTDTTDSSGATMTSADKLRGMTALLKDGGFGKKDSGGTATQSDSKCLANLFSPGCDEDPDILSELLTRLGTTDLANLKGVMTGGELGKHPEVIGKAYKHGCLKDADGAVDGTGQKDPQILKDMIGEFAGGGGPAAFKHLLVDGGLADAGKEGRLGSIMRYACAKRKNEPPPNRDGKVLKQFHTAFNGNMADLKTTIDAFESAPDTILEKGADEQPGKAFRNIVNAPGHGNGTPDATRLRSKFFTTLENQANASTGHVPAGNMPDRLNLDQLLQNTASFELRHYPAGNTPVTVGGGTKQLRIDHVMERHTRENHAFGLGGSSKTTLYPRNTTDANIKARVQGTWGNIPNPNRGNRPTPPGGGPKRNPPVDIYDLDGNYVGYPGAIPPGLGDGSGGQAKIGFNKLPPAGPGNTAVYIAQFFPVDDGTGTHGSPGTGGLLTVDNVDMAKMRDALR